MHIAKITILSISLFVAMLASAANSAVRSTLGRPDLEAIRLASTDPESDRFYPKLTKRFMANDTTMSDEDFQYFYYGTLFQEDYDPYRPTFRPKQLEVLRPIYLKDKQSRSECQMILDYALAALEDNPVNIQQLVHRVYAYEKNGKHDLAKIWQYKLNHILLVIASSGTGLDPETARVVVYPEHEYDFLNIAGLTATGQRFEEPYFDYIIVNQRNPNDAEGYYFDISEMLRQYFLKHPSELQELEDDVKGPENETISAQ